jgi:hypothetical protein
MHGFAFVSGKKVEYKPLDTLEDDYKRGLKDGVTEAKEWRKGMGGIAEELGEIVRKVWNALTTMPDIPDLLRLPTLPSVSGGVKQSRGSGGGNVKYPSADDLARRLGITKREYHRDIKKIIMKRCGPEMKQIGYPNSPEIGLDKAGNVWLKNHNNGKQINTRRGLSDFIKGGVK